MSQYIYKDKKLKQVTGNYNNTDLELNPTSLNPISNKAVSERFKEIDSNLKEVIKLSLTLDSSGYGTIALPDGWTYQNCHIISERISITGAAYGHYASTLTAPNYCGLYDDGILYYNNVNAPSAVVDVWLQKD